MLSSYRHTFSYFSTAIVRFCDSRIGSWPDRVGLPVSLCCDAITIKKVYI